MTFPILPTDVVLTGDRPTGKLHLGHYAGSLLNRVALQDMCQQTILVADLQALTDNAGNPTKVRDNTLEVVLDYLAVGIDPSKTVIALQSGIPELSELTMLYMNLVTVARLERNPTVKTEIASRGFDRSVPAGFLAYPVAQAADITAMAASVVPVGDDQLPMIELSNEIVSAIERLAGREVLRRHRAVLSTTPRLPGIDGNGKASKSAGNAISLAATADEIKQAVQRMYTDPNHIRVQDPGRVEGNVAFDYLLAFDPDSGRLEDLKARYRAGGLGDMVVKRHLIEVLEGVIGPIRERRSQLKGDLGYVRNVLEKGTQKARETAATTLREVRSVFGLG